MTEPVFLDWEYGRLALSVARVGNGPVWLFVPGLGLDKRLWAEAFPMAMAHGCSMATIDLPGFGDSSTVPDNVHYNFETHASAIAVAAKYLDAPLHLVLHSIASAILLHEPDYTVTAITFLEGNLLTSDAAWSMRIAEMTAEECDVYVGRLARAGALSFRGTVRDDVPRERLDEIASSYQRLEKRAFFETAVEGSLRTADGAILASVKDLQHPKRYLRGASSGPWDGDAALQSIDCMRFDIPDAGHMMMIEDPTRVYDIVFNTDHA